MLERLLRGMQLPGRDEIAAERARRVATIDGLPAGWEQFNVFKPWVRREENMLLLAEINRVLQAGVTVLKLVPELGGPQIVVSKGGVISGGPLVDRIHRRATIRYLLGLPERRHGPYPLSPADCIGAVQRRERRADEGCRCLVEAVERAEVVEVGLERAALLAARLAKCAHRVAHRERRRARRKERKAQAPHVQSARVPARTRDRLREPMRERFVERDVDELPEFVPRSRSLSPAVASSRRPLSDEEVAAANLRLGAAAPRSRTTDDGRVFWDE